MAHLALFPALLFNLTPTSGYLIEKEGKTMRLEVGSTETTAPAQRSTKFSWIFKLHYLKTASKTIRMFQKGNAFFLVTWLNTSFI